MILVKNILKKYDNKKVVNDVSVNIEKGKITSFIGPNGAGKSTALSMITRLMKRDKGEVFIEGKELESWDKKELSKKIKEKYEKGHQDYNISISIGIAFSEENKGQDYAELYKMADLALYQAKGKGKNGYMLYGNNMTKKPTQISQERRHEEQIIQLGESGFSVTKVLLDSVIDELNLKEDPKTTIEKVSKLIVDAFDVSRAYASCYTKDEMHIGRSYFYAQNDDYNITPHLTMSGREYEKKCFNSDGIFFCTDIEKSVEPVKSELKRMKVQTLLQVLIYKDGKIIGTLGINNCGYKRLWLQSEIEIIHTIGKLLTDTIYQLQQLSEEDF